MNQRVEIAPGGIAGAPKPIVLAKAVGEVYRDRGPTGARR